MNTDNEIKQLISKCNLSQKGFANLVNTEHYKIRKMCCGQLKTPPEYIMKLKSLEKSINRIFKPFN